MSVNGFYKGGHPTKINDLPYPLRKEKLLRYLNACYVDLDVGRRDDPNPDKRVVWSQAVGTALFYQDAGIIPQASIIARSGRGVYLLWLLTDEHGNGQRAFGTGVSIYKEINKSLSQRLEKIGADQVFDAARILRVAGSLHTKANRQVTYLIQADNRGQGYQYTLQGMAKFFGIDVSKYSALNDSEKWLLPKLKKAENPGSAPNRRHGLVKTAKNRVQDIFTIEQHKNGFNEGKRRKSITYIAEFMRIAGLSESKTTKICQRLAKNCTPSYPSHDDDLAVNTLVTNVYKLNAGMQKCFRNEYLARFFEVDTAVARELNLKSIMPPEVSNERKNRIAPRTVERNRRHLIIKKYLQQNPGSIPTINKWKRYLFSCGIDCSRQTICNDLKEFEKSGEISLRQPATPGRPRKSYK